MPQRAWRTTRDLAATLAALAIVQLGVSILVVGTLSPGMLAMELLLVFLLVAVALFAHLRRQALLHSV
jgi:hypothetical protein